MAFQPKFPKTPTTIQQNVISIFHDLKDGRYNLDIPYQRAVVWGPEQRLLFIDNLFNNVSVNPIMLVTNENQTFDCLDGKQRLTTIRMFMENQFPWEWNGTRYYYNELPPNCKKNAIVLNETDRQMFQKRCLSVVIYADIDEKQRLDIFERVHASSKLGL